MVDAVGCVSMRSIFEKEWHPLFPHSALYGLKFILRHSVPGCEIACLVSSRCRSAYLKGVDGLPAVILASISTRESAGISSSGSSTRSWIGMLFKVLIDGNSNLFQ